MAQLRCGGFGSRCRGAVMLAGIGRLGCHAPVVSGCRAGGRETEKEGMLAYW